jgi:UPF0755 protein
VRRVLAVGLVVVLLALAGGAYLGFVRKPVGGERITFDVASGETTSVIAARLKQQGVIGSVWWFRVLAKVRGADGRIQAGRYQLHKGMGVAAALDVISGAAGEPGVEVTIPEGFTVRQIASRLASRARLPAAAAEAAATNGSISTEIQPPGVKTLEGLLYPETYLVTKSDTAQRVVERMVQTFTKETSTLNWSYALSRGLTKYQAVIMASLIEREAKVPEDRTKVAAVIYNRLAIKMRLQIDATALYGLPEHKVPTLRDLRRESPYNTYLIPGLPPTPIASPGRAALEAAVHPASTNALYYVVCHPSGRHCFTDSPAEFQRLLRLRPPETTGR